MADRQDLMPAGAKVGAGVLVAALAMLLAHDGFGVAYPPFPPYSWWDWLYNVIEMGAAVLCGARAVLRRSERGAWAALAVGLAFYAAGDAYYTIAWGDANSVPTPSVADALYLSFYPATYLGIGLLLRARLGRLPAGLWLDGLIGATAVAAVGAAFVLGAVLSDTHGAPMAVATNMAYPLADLVLVGLVVVVLALTGWQLRGGWLLLAIGFGLFAVVDAIYLVQTADNTYVSNGLLDVGWPAAVVIMSLSAWRPPPRRTVARLDGWAVFMVPVVAAVACVTLEVYDHFSRIALVAQLLADACLLLVIVRLALSFAENLRMLRASRAEAVTDALTGLENRRALKLELETRLSEEPIKPFLLAFYDLDGFKSYNDTFGHQAGDALLRRLGTRAAAMLPEARLYRMGGDEFCVLVDEARGGELTAARAAEALTASGVSFQIGCSYGTVSVPREAGDADAAMLLADTRMYDHKGAGRPSAASESQGVLLRALAERNRELGQHNDDVAGLVELVSRELDLEPGAATAVRRAAELHDVGKLAIPDAILNKPGPLDEMEWCFMRQHTVVGERIVAAATSLRDVAPIVRSSHERWDGGGYPDGLVGEQIPLGARIVAVCDAYDAMTTTRPYRRAMCEADALEELRRCAGHQFDPRVVDAFLRAVAEPQPEDGDAERLAA